MVCGFTSPRLRRLQPLIAGLMAALFLAVVCAGASEWLHAQLHEGQEDEATHASCPACDLIRGCLESPPGPVPEISLAPSLAWTLPLSPANRFAAVDLPGAPSRGPPASVSSPL